MRNPLSALFAGRRPQRTLAEMVWRKPRPLLMPETRVGLIFSPKSACSAAVIWFWRQSGHYDRARAFSEWPHDYRTRVYYNSDEYKNATKGDLESYRFVRVIRDPYQRVISSYRHFLATGYWRDQVSAFLGRDVGESNRLSFREFLDFVDSENIVTTEVHHRQQMHPVERFVEPYRVINVSKSDLFDELNRVEEELGLPHTPFAEFDWFHKVEHFRKAKEGEAPTENVPDLPFDRESARKLPWPERSAFLTPEMRERIEKIYARDFEQYADYL